ncbi:uncharacterized protein CIMG_05860 [Coccidioides immitis RS]|uniref:RRM domain-containing protein n=1 Tax=Coccidioides immitis (strain RS) TaxID=246410 RepID=J3K6Y0_COCIM|nr:uncharacterized protein CIMG_05860 [Coccidioides immitis RS]EAS30381.3 hypothetical protein CIMG_05860 [Coccidioides immitis RS]
MARPSSFRPRRGWNRARGNSLSIVDTIDMPAWTSRATAFKRRPTFDEGKQPKFFPKGSRNVINSQDGKDHGYLPGKSHMNPEAPPFIPSYQGRQQQQKQHVQAPSYQVNRVPTEGSIPFPTKHSHPPVYTFPAAPFPCTHQRFNPQPYASGFEISYSSCMPSFWPSFSAAVIPNLPSGPYYSVSMAGSAGNNSNNKHWPYAPPTQAHRGPEIGHQLPIQPPIQHHASHQGMNPFNANFTRGNQDHGMQPPIGPPSRSGPIYQNPGSYHNSFQSSAAPNQQDYRGPLIVPPSLKPAPMFGGNIHPAISQKESHRRMEPIREQPTSQTTLAPATPPLARTTFTSNNKDALAQVKDISVANNIITIQGKPFEIPIDDGARYSSPPTGGVLKLMNIPYGISKQEVVHFMGRRAKLLPLHLGTAVHIIMDRSTAKTMDCYVEFLTTANAKETLEWLNRGLPGAPPRLGDRHIDVELSSQDELLKELFPRAKCIVWRDGKPILTRNNDPYSVGFQSFLTAEEVFCMIRNAEMPRRAPFATKCPQRTYEALISTLYKFPWHATTLYSVEDRNALHFACFSQLQTLAARASEKRTLGLDSRLLLDLLNAGLRCPTFTECQKAALYSAANDQTSYKATPETTKFWPFDTLVQKSNATEDNVNKFASLIAKGIERKNPGPEILANNWIPRPGIMSPFGPARLEFVASHTHLKWNMAVQYETKVLQGMVAEGLKAIREAPSRRNARAPLAP